MEANIKIFPDETWYFMGEDGMYAVRRKTGWRGLIARLFKRQLHEIRKINKL